MKIVVLTGAGISAESGLPVFRGAGGLFEGYAAADVATPEAFRRDPALVHRFYDERRRALLEVQPNVAHVALARLCRSLDTVYLVTQNVDDLHERAGTDAVVHLHGRLRSARCEACGMTSRWDHDLGDGPPCPVCSQRCLRPNVVWFGEVPEHLEDVSERVADCDLFVAIGTSGQVYPAAGFVELAAGMGARTLELNPVPTGRFDACRQGPATETVPGWVAEILR